MAEAERLCTVIGFLAHGKLVAEGTAAQLIQRAGAATLDDAFIKLTGEAIVEEEELAMVED
jgi:ABC-2 type transport system ATP-binding protein